MTQIHDIISRSVYLDNLSKDQIATIAAIGTIKHFKKGEIILRETDQGDSMLMITHGRVDVSVTLVGRGKAEIIATLGEGEVVGEMILLGKSRRTATVIAKDDVEVLHWVVVDLNKLFDSNLHIGFIIMRNIAKQMSDRLIAANQVLRNALSMSGNNLF